MTILERPCLIGGVTGSLIGVTTAVARTASIAAVIAPVPLHPRTGTHRLHVRLARELAQIGMPSLRFDPADGGDTAPGAAQATRYDGDLVAASRALLAQHREARLVVIAFGDAALPVARSLRAIRAAPLPVSALCFIDPRLATVRPIEPRGLWRRLMRRPSVTIEALAEASSSLHEDEYAWFGLADLLNGADVSLHVATGHDLHARELTRNLLAEDRQWHRALRKADSFLRIDGADAGYSQAAHWRTLVEWIARQLIHHRRRGR